MRSRWGAVAVAVVAVLLAAGCSGTGSTATAPASTRSAVAPDALVASAPGLVRPGTVHVAPSEPSARARRVVHVAQRLYTFWDTGDPRLLRGTVALTFHDRTLPPGRPQGPAGLRVASRQFRTAVPDLTCELADLYVVGTTFTARLVFRGHFTGTYDGTAGEGQRIRFGAIDVQHLGDGATITEDWHLEDNLTFLQQAGIVPTS